MLGINNLSGVRNKKNHLLLFGYNDLSNTDIII